MIAFRLDELKLNDFWQNESPRARGKGAFPLVGVPGTESSGMVYFEIAPGDNLALHTDSPDEILIVLSGTARATVGDETGELPAGSVAFVPGMVPHGFESIGDEPLRCVGIFTDSEVYSTFEYAMQPFGTRIVAHQSLVNVLA